MAASLLWRKKGEQFFDDYGQILSLGSVEYRDNATNNVVTVYKDSALLLPHAAKIALSIEGRLPESVYFPEGTFKETVYDADDNTLYNEGGYPGAEAAEAASGTFNVPRKTYSEHTPIPSGDNGYLIDIASAGTQLVMTLDDLAELPTSWHAWFRLTGATGSALISADGDDTINGNPSVALASQYQWALVIKGSSNFAALGGVSLGGLATTPVLQVVDKDLVTPPTLPATGSAYIVAADATGDWADKDGNVAVWTGTEWAFAAPSPGMFAWVVDEARYYHYETSWVLGLEVDGTETVKGLVAFASPEESAAGVSGTKAIAPGTQIGMLLGLLEDRKETDTDPGSGTDDAWTDHDLNTETFDRLDILSISSNQLTIAAAGTYEIEWWVQCYRAELVSRLYNVSDAAAVDYGTPCNSPFGDRYEPQWSHGLARTTITAEKTFSIQYHKSGGTLGLAADQDIAPEIYMRVVIRRG
jgi:uncharacterized protein DUF2793